MKLMHADKRFAHDLYYPFFGFDRITKNRIFQYNKSVGMSLEGRSHMPTTQELTQPNEPNSVEPAYNYYGKVMPSNVPGSKEFWKHKWLDLVATTRALGKPDFFVTLTANDNWPEVHSIIGNDVRYFRPVEMMRIFMKRFELIKPYITGEKSVLGKVKDSWYRVEFQQRGAPHVHMIVWVDKETIPKDVVEAQVPADNDDPELREKVLAYQVHRCVPSRCMRKKKPGTQRMVNLNTCKYGYPQPLRAEDGLDAEGMKYQYKRLKPEDTSIVSFNRWLLKMWGAHLNVVHVSQGEMLEAYLVKYISKCEPTFGFSREINSEVQKYFNNRLISAPEAVMYMMGYHVTQGILITMFQLTIHQGTRQVVHLDTSLQRFRKLKKLDRLQAQDPDSTDVFENGKLEYYMARPDAAEFASITYPDFVTNYETVSKQPKGSCWSNRCGGYVTKRGTAVIPRWHFLSPDKGEAYFYQLLLLKVPFRSLSELLSTENITKTYQEECYLRGVASEEADAEVALLDASRRGFEPSQLRALARRMLIAEVAPQATLNHVLEQLNAGTIVEEEDLEPQEMEPGMMGS
jgi:hypothetical protein